jgi:acyl-CoA thioesterase I
MKWLGGWIGLWMVASVHAQSVDILVHGDSLSAAYGLPVQQGWVHLMQQRCACRVVNSSQSGETTAGGLARLPSLLALHRPRLLVLELGANDGLRGLPLAQTEAHLGCMIALAQQQKTRILLIETSLPANYGAVFIRQYRALFGRLAQQYRLPAPVFYFGRFGPDPALFQSDGLHPTAAAQKLVLEQIWPAVRGELKP